MANLLKGRKASSNPSYEGFDLSHQSFFTSSVGHILPIHFDLLIPGDKVTLNAKMVSRMLPMNSASPITLREHVDWYFVPLECLYSLFPSLLSDTNEDASSSLFNVADFKDGIPLGNIQALRNRISTLGSSPSGLDDFGFDYRWRGSTRLIQFLKYGSDIELTADLPSTDGFDVNMLLAQAYQAVWWYFFRDDKRREFDASYFNIDQFYTTLQIDVDTQLKFFNLNYRPWKKDPYTLISPSPLGSGGSLNHFAPSGDTADTNFASFVQQWLSTVGTPSSVSNPTGSFPSGTPSSPATDVRFLNQTVDSPYFQSLQQHRIAQAIEKISSIWMQSGKNYKEMMSNFFGVKVRDDWSKPLYIGSQSNTITIDEEVANVSTAGADGSILTDAGEITGRGYGRSDGEQCKFTAERHGILLALYSCVPDAVYAAPSVDIFNLYSKRNSFPFPQTDELGEQPLFGFEISDIQGIDTSVIKGWLPRFHELKLKENRAYGAFRHSLSYWIPFRDEQAYWSVDWLNFYVPPTYLDSLMLQRYDIRSKDVDNWDMFDIDPLMHFFYIEENKASKMSSFGVPKTYFG